MLVQFFGHLFDAFENHLRLFADAHQDDAFHGLVLLFETELAQPVGVADPHLRQIVYIDRGAVLFGENDVADIFHVADQPKPRIL